jgi:LPS export ABC transporter protein LptC
MTFRILAAIFFVAIIAGSWWLGGQQREPTAPTTVVKSDAELGYSAHRARLIETGPDGKPMYTVNADVIRQRASDAVDFEQVQMSFRDQGGQLWTARARHGEMGQDTGVVELTGDVHVDGLVPGSSQNADLATEKLLVDTQGDVISTADPVTLNWGGRQLKSRGMVATLKERRLLLESSVHGSFPN